MNFKAVYDAHVGFVWRSLRRLGTPDSMVNDAVQDVFLVVHRRLPDYEPHAKITTWLFRICLHTARDYRQRAHVRREVADDGQLETMVDSGHDASLTLERRQDLALFEASLDKLDWDQRTVFMLFEIEKMTGDEIAEALEIPLGTVYSRLRLARKAFRRIVVQQARLRDSLPRAGNRR
jgi:RNA polymerase sigma-70 factor, ECF subfamily